MTPLSRIGALDIAAAIAERLGSFVDMNVFQFLAVEDDRIRCWYMNSGGKRPTVEIERLKGAAGWRMELKEQPAGTEQEIEVP